LAGPLTAALAIDALDVSIARHPILHVVSFTAEAGIWFGLLGANGSGKTTLLRALSGRLAIDVGSVRLNGEEVAASERARATRIGFGPPPDSLPDELTAGELLDLLGAARRADPRPAPPIYQALDIARLESQTIGVMSAGMRQRLCVFSAFVGAPAVVLLDEPFNWLDPLVAYDLKAALRDWTGHGGALVTALHDIATFATRCDAGLLLHEGRVAKTFEPAEIAAARSDILGFEQLVYDAFKTG
jgi:ABC-2 type transport system ATP-binding protein